MNKKLRGFLAMYKITYRHLSKELDMSPTTVCTKINNGTFTQKEIIELLKYLRKYDSSVNATLFFDD